MEEDEGGWDLSGRSFPNMEMEEVFQNQMMGLMQMANMMMQSSGLEEFMNGEFEEMQMRRNPYYNDSAPVPDSRSFQENHSFEQNPSFVAPHTYFLLDFHYL